MSKYIIALIFLFLTTPAFADMTTGLLGKWNLDGNGLDTSGLDKNGTVSGTTATTNRFSVAALALNFNGTSDNVDCGNVGDIKTVSFWIKPDGQTNGVIEFNTDQYVDNNAIAQGIVSATVYVDGVVTSPFGSELVTNGNFDSNVTGWSTVGPSSISWQNAASGDGSTGFLRFAIASNPFWDRFGATGNVVSPSTSYRVSYWYKTSGISGDLFVYFTSDFGTMPNLVTKANTLTAVWKFFSATMTATALSHPFFGISKPGDIGTGTFDVDAISVKAILSDPVSTAKWHHVVITTNTAISASAFKIGKGGTRYFGGSVDDVRAFDRVLTVSDITELYYDGTPTLGSVSSVTGVNAIQF